MITMLRFDRVAFYKRAVTALSQRFVSGLSLDCHWFVCFCNRRPLGANNFMHINICELHNVNYVPVIKYFFMTDNKTMFAAGGDKPGDTQ